jgi:peptidyl-tRNA hydrolase, PTH1 family
VIASNLKKLVVAGLGNPGPRYAHTRHNMGYFVVEKLARMLGWDFKEDRFLHARIAKGVVNGVDVHLILPTTYMNESGLSVKGYLNYYKMAVEDLIVVCDDIAIPFGTTRFRVAGSSGGHNGLKSVEMYLGTREYARLRMGVGNAPIGMALAEYVLGEFTPQESTSLQQTIDKAAVSLSLLTSKSLTYVMQIVNSEQTLETS